VKPPNSDVRRVRSRYQVDLVTTLCPVYCMSKAEQVIDFEGSHNFQATNTALSLPTAVKGGEQE